MSKSSRLHKVINFLLIFSICLSFLSMTGCEPFRKKFIRKKKEDKKNEFIPVLDPVDYDEITHSSQEKYKYHFGIWRVWENELLVNVRVRKSDKRLNNYAEQMSVQLAEMKKYIARDKEEELTRLINEINSIKKEINKPEPMRSWTSLQTRIERHSRTVREKFNPNGELQYK